MALEMLMTFGCQDYLTQKASQYYRNNANDSNHLICIVKTSEVNFAALTLSPTLPATGVWV